jgi:hypothetical protein
VLTGLGTNAQGQKYVQVTVQDAQSGLARVTVSTLMNAVGQVGAYQSGITLVPTTVQIADHTTNPVLVTATKINQMQAAQLALHVTDVAGNITNCDPILTTVGLEPGVPRRETFRHVASGESEVQIHNDTPGLEHLQLIVDGKSFEVKDLEDGETRQVDISGAMRRGSNTITVEARGKPGGSATMLIADRMAIR